MATQQLTPQQKNAYFAQMTRQHWQTAPMSTGSGAALGDSVQFDVPKVRLTSRIRMMITGDLKVTHATATSFVPQPFAPYNLIRRVSVDLNNGFSPFTVTGQELYMHSLIRDNAQVLQRQDSGRGKVVMGRTSSASGATNQLSFVVDLPLTLNDRDPVGLIVSQNPETTLTVKVDFVDDGKVILDNPTGYGVTLTNLKIVPLVESFSIPSLSEAFPDVSVLKLVQASREAIPGAGQMHVSLPRGYTYRKIIFLVTDANGKGVADADLAGNIEIVLNQADIPYRLPANHLAAINHEQFGVTLPQGVYAFDFSYQGISNLGGARDYFDTEKLTEFWLRFNAPAAGQITVVYEMLSRLRS
ncbi:cytoplasmic protein [Paenibacillus sp. FSL R7-0302]|uniref:cytoplasmic protein n=1 Tax=Paenibacillus sp. FSL R7-0302 TaxID=2921681 RepID=UPI0030F4DB81